MANYSVWGPRMFRPTICWASLLVLMGLAGCLSDNDSTGEPVPKGPNQLREQFFDYHLVETSNGIKQWVLDSSEMRKFYGQQEVLLITVRMNFFREGEQFSTLTADSGRANLLTRDVRTWGDVVVVTEDGRRLETEELFFSNESQLIHNDVFNRFIRDGDVLTGIGLEATPDLEYIEIKENVEAQVEDQDNPESGSR